MLVSLGCPGDVIVCRWLGTYLVFNQTKHQLSTGILIRKIVCCAETVSREQNITDLFPLQEIYICIVWLVRISAISQWIKIRDELSGSVIHWKHKHIKLWKARSRTMSFSWCKGHRCFFSFIPANHSSHAYCPHLGNSNWKTAVLMGPQHVHYLILYT